MKSRTALLLAMVAVMVAMVSSGCVATKYDVAKNCQDKAKYDDAIKNYQEFIKANEYPQLNAYALYNIAWCYRGKREKAKALDAYKKVTEQYPASEPAKWAEVERKRLEKMEMKPLPKKTPAVKPKKTAAPKKAASPTKK